MNARLYPLKENPQGLAFSQCQKRFIGCAAGRRSGKTERAKRKGIYRAIFQNLNHREKARYAWCAPTYAQAKSIFWDDLKAMTDGIRVATSESELMVRLFNNREIYVVGLDKPQRVEGSPWDGFLVDEVDDIKKSFWDEHLRPCLSDRRGWAILFGVPNGLGFLYDLSSFPSMYSDWGFFSWPSSEVLPPEEIANARATMDARTFKQEYEASFQNASGRVFYAFDHNVNVAEPPLYGGPLSLGLDFNVNPMSGVIFFDTPQATYVIDEIVISNSNTQQVIDEVRNRYGSRVVDCYPDPAGQCRKTSAPVGFSDHAILRAAGLKVFARSQVSLKDGINALNSRLSAADGTKHLFIAPKCKTLIGALERHCYKVGTSIPAEDGFEHITDALKYACEYLHPVRVAAQWTQS